MNNAASLPRFDIACSIIPFSVRYTKERMKRIQQKKLESSISRQLTHPDFSFIRHLTRKHPRVEIFLVGGAVRDALLGRPTKDFDFIVRNISARALERTLKTLGSINLVGKTFGVFKYVPKNTKNKEAIDIAFPRTEHTLLGTGGYKDFSVQSNPTLPIERDLERRDFTINAIAIHVTWNTKHGTIKKIIDPCNGIKDIQKKIIRTVGKPEERFKEDSTRMLRAIRFACQLDFTIEQTTARAITQHIHRLNAMKQETRVIPYELIGKEIVKAFYATPRRAVELLDHYGAIQAVMPELLRMKGCPQPPNWHTEGDVWVHTLLALDILDSRRFRRAFPGAQRDAEVLFGTLFHDIGKPYTIKTPERDGTDRIRFSEHDIVGARVAREICERLRLSQFPEETPLHINADHLHWIVAKHLMIVKERLQKMKATTIEKYFFNPNVPSEKLIQVAYADSAATIHVGGKPDLSNHRYLRTLLRRMRGSHTPTRPLPKKILDGEEIMRTFKIPEGPRIGSLLRIVREAQLKKKIRTKKEALALIRKLIQRYVNS